MKSYCWTTTTSLCSTMCNHTAERPQHHFVVLCAIIQLNDHCIALQYNMQPYSSTTTASLRSTICNLTVQRPLHRFVALCATVRLNDHRSIPAHCCTMCNGWTTILAVCLIALGRGAYSELSWDGLNLKLYKYALKVHILWSDLLYQSRPHDSRL